jgi:hypothetical protein
MKRVLILALAMAAGLPRAASAQGVDQYAGMLAAGIEGVGQSIGEAEKGGSSVFVTASGQAQLPAPITEAYLVNIEAKSGSAVEAYRLREERLKTARAIAQKFNVSSEIGATTFSREVDAEAQSKRFIEQQAERAAHPGVSVPNATADEVNRVFVARTGVRFRSADPAQLPAFLDALKAAGIDNTSGTLGQSGNNILFNATQVLGFGKLTKIDDSIWDQADQAAIAAARRQAQVLASAAGRQLGEVRQILFLARRVHGAEASVTLAVRFGFAQPN